MSNYPVVEQDGYCASVSTQREPSGRWLAWVRFERGADAEGLKTSTAQPQRVSNDYPSEERAIAAAYEFARERISNGEAEALI